MSALSMILDIHHLLDAICTNLQLEDIRNCAACCKAWYSIFGSHRFRSLEITHWNPDRVSFLHNNDHHIRKLSIGLPILKDIDGTRWTCLRKLKLIFIHANNGELGGDEDGNDEAQGSNGFDENSTDHHGAIDCSSDSISPTTKVDIPARVADLIQRNQGLRTLSIPYPEREEPMCLRSLAPSILDVVRNHSSLVKIKFDVKATCLILAKLINNLPQQLQVLEINAPIVPVVNHDLCDVESHLFKSQDSLLNIRCLHFGSGGECFSRRSFIQLLRRCPDLESLQLPLASNNNEGQYDVKELAQVLDSNCKRLSTMHIHCYCPICDPAMDMSVLLQRFSRGFQTLYLWGVGCRHDVSLSMWPKTVILETLITTATVNTIQVLSFSENFNTIDPIIGILKHCPRLRQFFVFHFYPNYKGMKASDLLFSMETPWKCQDALEALQLKVYDPRNERSNSGTGESLQDAEQDIEQLHLRLRAFPRLTWLKFG
ncbi:MAG: hypothetical protein J3Q66DRAFT_326074 [Benniella sp.]|nr:MAG: hypothetical protein J3Q66DRAFT_326074 [Benniella sp.]